MARGDRTDEDALDLARELAIDAVEALRDVMDNPQRNSGARVTAATKILEIAGVGALEADRRHEELLTALRSSLSKEGYAEVVRALARHSGAPSNGAGEARH